MGLPFDMSLFVAVLALVVSVLTGLLYFENDNLLIKLQKGVLRELSRIYADTIRRAERYSHGTNVTGRKLKIKRCLGKVIKEYTVPKNIITVSGLALVGWLLCFSLAFDGFVFSGLGNMVSINIALLSAQYNFILMGILAWFCYKTKRMDYPILFLLLCLLLWLIATVVATLTAIVGWYIPAIPSEYVSWAFILTLIVPLTPICVALYCFFHYLWSEYGRYKTLVEAVKDFEKYRNNISKKKS